jgi:DNA-binding XRE family transcriptional regulator
VKRQDINKHEVAERIKIVRKELCGMTQADFGIALNPENPIRQSTVREWETGKILPNTERQIKIAKLGGVTVSWLLFGDDKENLQNHKLVETHRMLESLEKFPISHGSAEYRFVDSMIANIMYRSIYKIEDKSEDHVALLNEIFSNILSYNAEIPFKTEKEIKEYLDKIFDEKLAQDLEELKEKYLEQYKNDL